MTPLRTVLFGTLIALFGMTAVQANAPADSVKSEEEKQTLFAQLEQGLLYGLSSDVNGVIDATLFNAIHYKVEFPEFTSERLKERVYDLAVNADTHTLRFKAYLTLNYYMNQDEFEAPENLAGFIDNRDKNRIFYQLQSEIQEEHITVLN
jgi:hypothetical protein